MFLAMVLVKEKKCEKFGVNHRLDFIKQKVFIWGVLGLKVKLRAFHRALFTIYYYLLLITIKFLPIMNF